MRYHLLPAALLLLAPTVCGAAGPSGLVGSCLEYVHCQGPAQLCARLHFDPEGILAGQVTAFLDLPVSPDGTERFIEDPFIFGTHPEYGANIVGSQFMFFPDRQRVESVVQFNFQGQDPPQPPATPVEIFQWAILDAAGAGLEGAIAGFEFRQGDFLTIIDLETQEVQTLEGSALQGIVFRPNREIGDFDGDNLVNGEDYTIWRDALGSAYNEGDYLAWQANFGKGPTSAGPAVPEAATATLAVCALAGALGFHRRRR